MSCSCTEEERSRSTEEHGDRHEVLSGGRVVHRSRDHDSAVKVAARWPGGTVRTVGHDTPAR